MNHLIATIQQSRKSCVDFVNATFDVLLEKVNASNDFLAGMNATNPPETTGEYKVSMLVEAPPEIPTLENVKPLSGIENHIEEVIEQLGLESTTSTNQRPLVEQLTEKLDLEKTGETPLMPQDRFDKLCAYVLKGHDSGLDVSANWVTERLMGQGLAITTKQEEYLAELRKLKAQFLAKELDLNQSLGQVQSEAEKTALRSLAVKHRLK